MFPFQVRKIDSVATKWNNYFKGFEEYSGNEPIIKSF